MKRRGARVVSASSAVSGSPTLPNPAHASANAECSIVDVVAATGPALAIPTLNIFARFQKHRDDFDADWLMVKEDPLTGEEKPALSAHVADKLRRHQAQLGAHRAAAAADRTAARLAQASSGTSDGAAEQQAESVKEAVSVSRRTRRPDMYATDEDEGSVSAAVDVDVEEAMETQKAIVGEGDEEGDYEPEGIKAAQYRHAKAAANLSSSSSPPPPPRTVEEEEVVEVLAPTPTPAVAAKITSPTNEGLSGDYLNFQSITAAGGKALAAGALQATVHMSATAPGTVRGGNTAATGSQSRSPPPRRLPRDAAVERTVVVPLWSIARMERHGGYCTRSPLIALHQEITDLVDYLRPTEAEVTMRRFVEQEVGKLVSQLWPGARVMVYGSMYTQLLLPLSDLDMTLLDVPVPAEEALTALATEISNAGLCESSYPQVILKTKVPLIKFAHKGSLIDVDISVGALDGKRNSECVMRYLNTYPEAMPLVITVKYFLMQRGMHEPYHGGLGSYAATLLVIAFLRQHPIYTTQPEERAMTGLGKLFVDFLRMCGQYWNYARVAISLGDLQLGAGASATASATEEGDFRIRNAFESSSRMQSPVSPASPRGPMGPAQSSIEDPVDPANNAASSLRLFHSVASMFTYAYTALTADFTGEEEQAGGKAASTASTPSADDISRRPTLLSRIFHVDAEMVFRRQAIASTYARLCTEMPAYMADVRRFREAEDAAMLPSNGRSWRERRQERRGGEAAPFLWEKVEPRSVTSLAERLALANLSDAASATASATKTAVKSPKPTAAASASNSESGNPWKRLRSGSGDGGRDDSSTAAQRRHRRADAVSVDSSSDGEGSSGYDSGSRSNASSVRVDVSHETARRRRMRES